MKFKIGDKVYYKLQRPRRAHIVGTVVGTVVSTTEKMFSKTEQPGYAVLWETQSTPMTPYNDESLVLVCDPNDLLKNLL